MEIISFKCPEKLAHRLKGESKRRKLPKSDLLRQALEFYLDQKGSATPVSFYSLSKDLCGALHGPKDLSENPSYFQSYGQ